MVGKKRNGQPFTINDFLPDYCRRKTEPKDPKLIEARLKASLNALAKQNKPHG